MINEFEEENKQEFRKCHKCDKTLELISNFSKKGTGRQLHCKKCHSNYCKHHYSMNKSYYKLKANRNSPLYRSAAHKFIVDYLLSHPCVDCGNKNILVLEFDHVTGKKSFNISTALAAPWALVRIKEEITKCEVRCANCHKIVTAQRGNNYRIKYLNSIVESE